MNTRGMHSTIQKKESHSATLRPSCSCPKCDSIDCFATRDIKEPCSCIKCGQSKTCLYYLNKLNFYERNSELNIALQTNTFVNHNKKIDNGGVEKEINNDLNRYMKGGSVTQIQSTDAKPAIARKSNLQSKSAKDDTLCTHRTPNEFSRTNLNTTTEDLRAQIMNVPYRDYKKYLSLNKADNSHKQKITRSDLFQRIKEAYKACSCKVCECVIGKSQTRNKLCKCKPCECNDCLSYLLQFGSSIDTGYSLPVEGSPCVQLTRTECEGVNKFKEPQICDCEPCDCINCVDSFNKLCNCKPCQCVECNAMSIHLPTTYIVAPVSNDYQCSVCRCSPCNCAECAHGYGIPSHMRHEIATGINVREFCHCEDCVNEAFEPEGTNSCKCRRRNKLIIKPFEEDVHDYDIRTMSTTNMYSWKPEDKHVTSTCDNNTIALFTTLQDQYSTNKNIINNSRKSNRCECFVSNCNENAVNSIKSSQIFKEPILSSLESETIKCSLCESESCYLNDCSCKSTTCDHLNKEQLMKTFLCQEQSPEKFVSKLSSRGVCKNDLEHCSHCRNHMYAPGDAYGKEYRNEECLSCSTENIYPIKRAKLLTPSILNGIECESVHCINKRNSLNSDNLLKISDSTSRKVTDDQNQSYRNISTEQQSSGCGIINYGIPFKSDSLDAHIIDSNNDNVNTDQKNNITLYSKFNNSSTDNIYTVNDRIKVNGKVQSVNAFRSDITEFPSKYNILNTSKLNGNYNLTLHDSKSVPEDIIKNSVGYLKMDELYLGISSTKNTICTLPQANNQSQYINRVHISANHIVDNTFTNNAYSMTLKKLFVNDLVRKKMELPILLIDYKNVKKTLYQAKADSLHLLKVLDKYERASKDFKSISQKLKFLHDLPLTLDDSFQFTFSPLTEDTTIDLYDRKLTTNEVNHGIKEHGIRIIEPKSNGVKEKQQIINTIDIRETKPKPNDIEIAYELKSPVKLLGITKIEAQNIINADLNKQDIRGTQNKDEPNTHTDSAITKHCLQIEDMRGSSLKKQRKVASYKSTYSKLLRRAIILSKKIDSARKITKGCTISKMTKNMTSQIVDISKNINFKEDMILNKPIFCQMENIKNANQNNWITLESIVPLTNSIKKEKKKNFDELNDIKCITQTYHQSDLNIVVKGPIDYKLSQSVTTGARPTSAEISTKTASWIPITQNTKTRYEALKVNALGLQRVSDHTVLVKWNVPPSMDNVQGYELQVDGRAVQTILNPTRNVAVLTCLPHSYKVLLTIRTIMKFKNDNEYHPTVTVIYHPRKK